MIVPTKRAIRSLKARGTPRPGGTATVWPHGFGGLRSGLHRAGAPARGGGSGVRRATGQGAARGSGRLRGARAQRVVPLVAAGAVIVAGRVARALRRDG